jgi:MFS family permease
MSDFPPPPPRQGLTPPPPGYVSYGAPGAYTAMKPIRGIGKAVVVLQALAVLGTIAVLIVNLSLTESARDFADGVSDGFDDDLGGYVAAAALSGLISVAALVLLIIWSFRIASNLRAHDPGLVWKPGLTIVAWLLGGCTLGLLQFLMLREHWKKSDPDGQGGSTPVSPLIVAWFVLTLAQVAAGIASGLQGIGGISVAGTTEDVAERLSDQIGLTIASSVLGIASAIVLLLIVRQLTDRHARFTREA